VIGVKARRRRKNVCIKEGLLDLDDGYLAQRFMVVAYLLAKWNDATSSSLFLRSAGADE